MKKITKKELGIAIAESLATTKEEGKNAVDVLFDEMVNSLSEGKTVDISGFGKFEVSIRSERNGVNPATKEPIVIPEGKVVRFKPSKKLKNQLK